MNLPDCARPGCSDRGLYPGRWCWTHYDPCEDCRHPLCRRKRVERSLDAAIARSAGLVLR